MLIAAIEGVTRIIGKSQGYLGLPLRDEVIHCAVTGEGTPAMVSAWQPARDELARLNAGASVHLRVIGTQHPPVMIEVGQPPAWPPRRGGWSKVQRERQRRTRVPLTRRFFSDGCGF